MPAFGFYKSCFLPPDSYHTVGRERGERERYGSGERKEGEGRENAGGRENGDREEEKKIKLDW